MEDIRLKLKNQEENMKENLRTLNMKENDLKSKEKQL